MIVCYESDVLFVAGLSIGLWVATMVGMGCAMFSMKKKSYADQIEEMMFEHIVKQLHEINLAEAFEQEQEEEEEQEQEEEQVDSDSEEQVESDSESEEQEQVESEESNDADNEEDIECIEETHTNSEYDDLPDLVEEPVAPVESSSESSDLAPPSKRARRGRGRGRGRM